MNRNPETAEAASGFFTDGEMENRTQPGLRRAPGTGTLETAWKDSAMHTVEEYLEDRKQTDGISRNTELAYRSDLKNLMEFAGRKGVVHFDDMSAPFLIEFKTFLQKSGKSTRTVSRTVGIVKNFYKYLFRHGLITLNYAEEIDIPKSGEIPPRVLSLEEISRLLSMPDPGKPGGVRDKALMELMYSTGLRVSEITGLCIGNIDLQISCIILPGQQRIHESAPGVSQPRKSGKDRKKDSAYDTAYHREEQELEKHEVRKNPDDRERFIPFGSRAREALKKYLVTQRERITDDESLVFVNRSGGAMSRQSIWKIIRKYADQAGIEDCSPEVFRTSLAAHLLENGADPESVKDILGFSSLHSVQRYESGGEGSYLRKVYGQSQKLN